MEVYEVINKLLETKGLTKREFASKLISLEPRSNRTGEVISEKIIYSYLSGKTSIQAYLIPYIADVLGVSEQFLFGEDPKVRRRLLQHLLHTINNDEYEYIAHQLQHRANIPNHIIQLLQYAPYPLIKKLQKSLLEIKKITDDF